MTGTMVRSWIGRMSWVVVALGLSAGVVVAQGVSGQGEGDGDGGAGVERPQEMSELDKLAEQIEKRKKEEQLPRFEMFRSQVLPLDVLPLVKANHWATLVMELRSNKEDYRGELRTAAEVGGQAQAPLWGMPQGMVYRRDALLPKKQTVRRELPVFLPSFTKSTNRLLVELAGEEGGRAEVGFEALIQRLEPHQMLVPVLSAEPDAFEGWTKLNATLPSSVDFGSPALVDRQRYYRLVMPMRPDLPPALSTQPLDWTTTSHVIWKNYNPELLSRGSFSQQRALLDWIHWGGQLVIVATGPSLSALEDSELGPLMPARYGGQADEMTEEEQTALAEDYQPPRWGRELEDWSVPLSNAEAEPPAREKSAERLEPVEKRPLLLSRLEPRDAPGVEVVKLGGGSEGRPLAVEWRVGRGRVTMLAVDPNDPTLVKWRGLDTLLRRVVLRRPLESWFYTGGRGVYRPLSGPELSWVRYVARDLGAEAAGNEENPTEGNLSGELPLSNRPTAAWLDASSAMPKAARDTLERSSGIVIPKNDFVAKVILSYLVLLVPLNWLVCRYVLRRRELAWVVAPVLALGFAFGVERMAAVDVGFNSSCDEIDVIEVQGDYARAHLTRFGSIYTSGRVEYQLKSTSNPGTLILPMRAYQELRGEQTRYSSFDAAAEPSLGGYLVQPRSLAMFRSEAMVDLGGGIVLEGDWETGRIVNRSGLELLDAGLVRMDREGFRPLGRIGPWTEGEGAGAGSEHVVELGSSNRTVTPAERGESGWAGIDDYLKMLREYRWGDPQEAGGIRLVAWAREPHPGLEVTPGVDRRRGVRLVVAHLRFAVPSPSGTAYDGATRVERDSAVPLEGSLGP